ncbi:hypothetical protein JC2156_05640 [Weissella koreensis KCTC 3621]|uniref:hypothetical protein n=1 Tax=Weissella koreensis TaxID=165096 RepID=UPI00026F3EEE|nr:hypothetical protein [Weissella koreensis]EJF33750.1 hypothetical protein JC2156_05640 [Weissella koreensis KCTC 3621]
MPMIEAKNTIYQAIDDFSSFLNMNGYRQRSNSRKQLVKDVGMSDQRFSELINGKKHGRAAFDKLNEIFNYVGYSGENWVMV